MVRKFLLALSLGVATMALPALAQDGGGGPGGPGGDGGGDRGQRGQRGDWNPEEMQKRMMERLKEQLKAPDDEWAVIQPKLEKVMTAQRDARVGGMGGPGGRMGGRNRDGGENNENASPLAKASRDLREVLRKDDASESEINESLKAYREAKVKAEESLKTARAELKEVLSPRQEATFVMIGMLE